MKAQNELQEVGAMMALIGVLSAGVATYADYQLQYSYSAPNSIPDNWVSIAAMMEHVDPADNVMGGLIGVYSIPLQLCGWASMAILFVDGGMSWQRSCLCVLPSAYACVLCASYHIQVTHVGLVKALPSQEGIMIFQLNTLVGIICLASLVPIIAFFATSSQMPWIFFLFGNQGLMILFLTIISKSLPEQIEKAVGMCSINLALVIVFSAVLWQWHASKVRDSRGACKKYKGR